MSGKKGENGKTQASDEVTVSEWKKYFRCRQIRLCDAQEAAAIEQIVPPPIVPIVPIVPIIPILPATLYFLRSPS